MNDVEVQVVQAVGVLLWAAVTAAIATLTPKAKGFIEKHAGAKHAEQANAVIDGLGKIAESVVQDFNQRIVADAKANGVWNADLSASVKRDAVQAVLDQGAQIVALGRSVVGNVDGLVSSLIEEAVAHKWLPAPPPKAEPVQQTEPTPQTTAV